MNDVGTLHSKRHYIHYSSYDSQIPIFNVGTNVETVPNINFRILGPLGITLKFESYLTHLPQTFYFNVDTFFLVPPSCTEEIKDMCILIFSLQVNNRISIFASSFLLLFCEKIFIKFDCFKYYKIIAIILYEQYFENRYN